MPAVTNAIRPAEMPGHPSSRPREPAQDEQRPACSPVLASSACVSRDLFLPLRVRSRDAPERFPPQAVAAGFAAGLYIDIVRLQAAKGPVRKPPNRSRTRSSLKDTGGILPYLPIFSLIGCNPCSDGESAVKAPAFPACQDPRYNAWSFARTRCLGDLNPLPD